MKKYGLFLVSLLFQQVVLAQTWQANWGSLDQRPVPQWFKDAKFGIFIHWGVYSVPGWSSNGQYAEWYQQGLNSGDSARIRYHKAKFGDLTYYQLADQFKAELYNPDEWAHLIEQSGAKYVVLTSKHHDGWANWPSAATATAWSVPWNAGVAGPHRDLLGDLFTAIRKTSVHPGMYYSLYEWFNPLYEKDKAAYVSGYMWPQMKDLINTYRPDVFWTDGDWDGPDSLWKSPQFLAWLYNESPVKDRVVTYDRWGAGIRFHHGGVYTPEYQPNADFEDHAWEESRGMGFSYGYNRGEDSWDYNSTQSLVLQLIDKVSRGGNFLLDIGPDEHGKIPPIMEERLLQIGDWMKINGEAIYNTIRWREPSQWSAGSQDYRPKNGGGDILLKLTVEPDPGYAVKECFFTYSPTHNDLYAILPKWPVVGASGAATFTIHDLVPAGARIELLETHETLNWHLQGSDCVIELPPYDPVKMKSAYAYVIKLNNTGAFAPRPAVTATYPGKAIHPLITVRPQTDTKYFYTLDGTNPTESSSLYSEPFAVSKSVTLNVRGFRQGGLPGAVVRVPLQVFDWTPALKPGKVRPGLHFKAFEGPAGGLQSIKEFTSLSPAAEGFSAGLSRKGMTRKENAGLVFDGYIKMPADGIYTLYLSSDDGSGLWIDSQAVIDNDGLHGTEERSVRMPLKKGFHAFRLDYFNGTGGGDLLLQYSKDGKNKTVVPDEFFFQPVK
jgi:alpha-L-fucosidase